MIAMTAEYLALVVATIYRRRVREELELARHARALGFCDTAALHLDLALLWRRLAADWTRFASTRTRP